MTGLGTTESLLILCLCGFVLLGLVGFGVVLWLLVSERLSGEGFRHGGLAGLEDDDHPQYLTAERAAALTNRVDTRRSLGDLEDVKVVNPVEGQVLFFHEGVWQAQGLPASGGQVHLRRLVEIRRENPRVFEFWFTPDVPGNQAEINDLPLSALQIFRETENQPKFLTRIPIESVERVRRNVFRVISRQESEFMRFTFDLVKLPLSNDRSLRVYALENNLHFINQGGDHTVTVHLRVN